MATTKPDLRTRVRRFYHHIRTNWPWTLYQRAGINNLVTNRKLYPVEGGDGEPCRLVRADYDALLALDVMERFRKYPFVFDKVLEYAVSIRLLGLEPGKVLLDAAGGFGEYAAAALELCGLERVYCLDAVRLPDRGDGVERLVGDVSAIPLPDASLDAISCHHSFEHFQGEADVAFIREIGRVLRPGGRACIIPFFLCNRYAEIRNVRGRALFDPKAMAVYDPFGTFPGWGPFERFARVYDRQAFEGRLLPAAEGRLDVSVHPVFFESEPCPDMSRNHHQPRLNGLLKALILTRRV
ncbi:class I SAM-dependent methyltransferase [Pseudodesulfovibrio methanolicus]|uniref:Methyltransferase domain-containing protein n=1 Tax=Pseudodesulfovibrio methanolicus TaxID=3126690 RepID=A0ABZ2J4C8_9BACT